MNCTACKAKVVLPNLNEAQAIGKVTPCLVGEIWPVLDEAQLQPLSTNVSLIDVQFADGSLKEEQVNIMPTRLGIGG